MIKATRWRIACAVLVIISTYFTLFYINYKEHSKPVQDREYFTLGDTV